MYNSNEDSLLSIISPMPIDEFLSNYYGKDMLYLPGHKEKFKDYFSWKHLNTAIGMMRLPYPRFKMIKNGSIVAPSVFMRKYHSSIHDNFTTNDIHHDLVLEQIKDGAVLVLHAVQDIFPRVKILEKNLQWFLQDHVNVNMYLGWGKSRAFDYHFDDHDVLVMQILGSKNWYLLGVDKIAPDDRTTAFENPPKRKPNNLVLKAGDLLYLPRGYWHRAEACDEITLHLTIGIYKRSGVDFLNWLTQKIRQEETTLRMDIPRQHLGENIELYVNRLQNMIVQYINSGVIHKFLEENNTSVLPPKDFSLPYSIPQASGKIPIDLFFRINSKRPPLLVINDKSFTIYMHNREWKLERNMYSIMEYIASGKVLNIKELIDAFSSNIEYQDIERFIKLCFSENIVCTP